MGKDFKEQYCQPAGNVYGVNISIKADRQLVLEGPNAYDMQHEPNIKSLVTGKTILPEKRGTENLCQKVCLSFLSPCH